MFLSILGWVGAAVILSGYGLFSLGRLSNGPVYQLSNLVGALFISLNVAAHGAWPSAVVNGVWAIIAAVVLTRMLRVHAAARRAAEAARLEETERRIRADELRHVAAPTLADSVPVVTAALAIVALAAVQHEVDARATEARQADTQHGFASSAAEPV